MTVVSLFAAFVQPLLPASAPQQALAITPAAPAGATFTQAGRTVIVTGSSKGIGKGIAAVFAEAGANVLVMSRHLDEAEAVANEIISRGGAAHAFAGNVAIEEDVVRMVDTAVDVFGGIDVVCANAGIIPDGLMRSLSESDWDQTFDINVKGTFLTVKHALPHLKRSPFGRVVITSSITGPITGFPGWSHYGASKAAQLGFMRSAAVELAASRVTINAVLPGNIATEGLAALGEQFLDGVRHAIPLGQLGTVRDIGYACLYLASKEAAFVTGTTLVVDGGQTVPESEGFRDKWTASGLI
eukprot:CAMPEP_0115837932 /NCGR_PEP_ID=MMETSP0287-20121206/5471_1 /TAXON_ID=412157 /ORGANISM="Chrysochromulina rotalis, Strain UIO044" /LENGTH=298 /DNA_ID=CAMNT_0003291449 /DNA_START=2 /DNA_END=898 /DNA_ORIENTATION=+